VILTISEMSSGYGAAPVLHEVSFDLAENETLAVLGPNGAGKSTLLMSIMGLLPLKQGRVVLDGRDLTGLSPDQRAGAGISWVPEGRRLFPSLTVHENLLVAGRHLHRDDEAERLEEVLRLFPDLSPLLDRAAWALSGGQQQMVAVGRALVARPRVLLLDEPSLGLAPMITQMLMDALDEVGTGGQAMVLVEQNVMHGLRLADRAIMLTDGKISFSGYSDQLLSDDTIRTSYLTGTA
jgi:branched-chain amino acid transport system ATP-binding protein